MKYFIRPLQPLEIDPSIATVMALVGGILLFASVSTTVWRWVKPHPLAEEIWVRTRSWWVMTLIFFGSLLIHPILSFIGLAYLSFAVLRELYSKFPFQVSDRYPMALGYASIIGVLVLNLSSWGTHIQHLTWLTGISFIGIPILLLFGDKGGRLASRWSLFTIVLAISVWSIGYLGLILKIPIQEGLASGGKGLILFLVCVTELNDVFQFLVGKWIGKNRLVPHISPGKTWEGFLGGIAGSMVLSYFLSFLVPFSSLQSVGLGALLSIMGVLGDLLISAVKRELHLKDMGNSIPGHGGVLDRVDSLLFSSPIFYFLVGDLGSSIPA